ncbi:MAG: helix-turn-helix domain-containing protein [Oscillospiraceae bacterium]
MYQYFRSWQQNSLKNTLYDLLRSGKIKFYMEGKKYKIPQKSVEEYVKIRLT